MAEDKSEIEKPETRVIEINEWFTPFGMYNDTPYEISRSDYRSKNSKSSIRGIGIVDTDLVWSEKDTQELKENEEPWNVLLVLPNGSKKISLREVFEEQRKLESRLLDLSFDIQEPKWVGKNFPYSIEVKLPDGTVVESRDSWPDLPIFNGHTFTGARDMESGSEFGSLLVPEAENILKRIEVRIVPKT